MPTNNAPTMDEVRSRFAWHLMGDNPGAFTEDEARAMFDRALAAHEKTVLERDAAGIAADVLRGSGWLAPEDVAAHDAELREQIATEIEADCVWELEDGDGLCGICADAAKTARGKE